MRSRYAYVFWGLKITLDVFAFITSAERTFVDPWTINTNKGGGLYSTGQNNVDKGWFFGVGLTYMAGYNDEVTTIDSTDVANNMHSYQYTGDPKGKFGLFAEIGKFKMNDKRFINYIDLVYHGNGLEGMKITNMSITEMIFYQEMLLKMVLIVITSSLET